MFALPDEDVIFKLLAMYIEMIISIDNTYEWCYHLSLGCLQEARIHSGLLLLSLVMEYLVAHQTSCPSATRKHCPRDVAVFSGSQPEKSPHSSPAPRLCRSPPSSQTRCGPSSVESGTATWPAQDNTTRPVLVTWREWEFCSRMMLVFQLPVLGCRHLGS